MVARMSQSHPSRRLLFYVEQNYSFDILRPLQAEARRRKHEVRWLVVGEASRKLPNPGEQAITSISAAITYGPDAVFAPSDRIPGFIPGLKVQVFHGINEDKRGEPIPERGLFDLYCTQSPAQAAMLLPLQAKRGYFQVVDTGWIKLDAILEHRDATIHYTRPQILYASTFTPSLSSAKALLPEIKRLSQKPNWQWLVTLHPKMDPAIVAQYQSLENDNLKFFGTDKVIELLHRADIMVSDNSSILQEFLLLNKPVITFRNRAPHPCMINITATDQMEAAIAQALNPDEQLRKAVASYGPAITPHLDGQSSGRVLDATEKMLGECWKNTKPANIWRNFKMRRQLNYYKFW